MNPRAIATLALAVIAGVVVSGIGCGAGTPVTGSPPSAVRMYVFDCGALEGDVSRFHLNASEVATARMSVACFLVVHPKGTLMWDVGAVPDGAWSPTGGPVTQRVVLPDGQERTMTVVKPLGAQLMASGYAPGRISYLALSHYHWDHTANANDFAGATWLVRPEERDAMFPASGPGAPLTQPSTYRALRTSRTVLIHDDDYDVFGDGTVVMKKAPGHTPGHQVLYVQLPKTGGVVLSGDLYHYPEERTLNRLPTFEVNPDQTVATRASIDAFLAKTRAKMWIQHDFTGNAQLKKSPAYYD